MNFLPAWNNLNWEEMRQPKWNKKSDKREENPMTKNIEGERNLKLYDSSCIIPQHIPLVPNDDAFHSEIPIFTFCNLADVFKNFSNQNSTNNKYVRIRCTHFLILYLSIFYQLISDVKYLIYEMKSMFIKYVSICQIFIRIICPMWKLYQTIHEDAMSQNQTSKEERRKGETLADIQHAKRI